MAARAESLEAEGQAPQARELAAEAVGEPVAHVGQNDVNSARLKGSPNDSVPGTSAKHGHANAALESARAR